MSEEAVKDNVNPEGKQPEQEERVSNKFKALYEQDKAIKVREEAVKEKEGVVGRFDGWNELSKREKIARLKDDDLYDEYSSVIAEEEETPEERERREWDTERQEFLDEREAGKKQLETERITAKEIEYKKGLGDFITSEDNKEEYGILSNLERGYTENLLYQHADNYAAEYGELPDNKELSDYVENQLYEEAKVWSKIPKIRELLNSDLNDNPPVGQKSNEKTTTMNNNFEASKPKTQSNSKETWAQMEDRKRMESIEKFGM